MTGSLHSSPLSFRLSRDRVVFMQIVADLHIHSKYSRACSKDLVLEKIAETCQMKGVQIVGTGDFTHPLWFKEMKEKLVEKEPGLYVLKNKPPLTPLLRKEGTEQTRFICSSEISCIYSKGGKCRRLHIVILAPSLEVVEKINLALEKAGCNLKSDGRPIIGMDVIDLAKLCWSIDKKCFIIPAHIWTPWFAMFGSKSGFDSIEECWEDVADKIFAIETGLSSDPIMNWRVKNLDNVSIISNSDAHSLPNIAREANVFEINSPLLTSEELPVASRTGNKGRLNLSFDKICNVIKEKNPKSFLYTVEFYPEEGMYHWDGHRVCNLSCSPTESKKLKNICPVCKKPLVIGVENRVVELAEKDRNENFSDSKRVPFKKLIELDKIIAQAIGIKSRKAKKVQEIYLDLIKKFGNEFEILLNVDYEKLKKETLEIIVEGIKRVREGNVKVEPGFDGEYGKIKIFSEKELEKIQSKLF